MKLIKTFSSLAVLGLVGYALVGGISNCKKKDSGSKGGGDDSKNAFIPGGEPVPIVPQPTGSFQPHTGAFATLKVEPVDLVLAAGPQNQNKKQGGYVNGIAKTIKLTNTSSSDDVTNISISANIPSKMYDMSKCTSIPMNGGTCEITFTPGDALDTTQFTITGQDNYGNAVTANATVTVLDYGSKYQDGIVFALTPNVFGDRCNMKTEPIYTKDTCSRVVTWTLAQKSAAFPTDITPFIKNGISDLGVYNGVINTNKFLSVYPSLSNNYVANICDKLNQPSSNFGWYLPAICELGGRLAASSTCLTSRAQSVEDLRYHKMINIPQSNGLFWSSTIGDAKLPFYIKFAQTGGTSDGPLDDSASTGQLSENHGVLCAHIITDSTQSLKKN